MSCGAEKAAQMAATQVGHQQHNSFHVHSGESAR